MKTFSFLLYVLLISPCVYSSNEIKEITQQISHLYADYRKVKAEPTIRDLVHLDQRLRRLEEEIRCQYQRPGNQLRTLDHEGWTNIEKASGASYASRRDQMLRTKAKAIFYYQRFVRKNPKDALTASYLDEVKKETVRGWTFCPD